MAFYQQLLGMTLHARWDSGAYLSCGDLWLCLSLDPQRRVTPPEESDYTHYAFSISEADFASFAARLEAAGVAIWKLNRSEGASHYFLDPDGHKLELHVGSLAQRLPPAANSRIRGWCFDQWLLRRRQITRSPGKRSATGKQVKFTPSPPSPLLPASPSPLYVSRSAAGRS